MARRPEGCEADDRKLTIVSTQQLKSEDAYSCLESLYSPMECLRISKSLRGGLEIFELTDVTLHLEKYAMLSTTTTVTSPAS